jgi:hypothetical protein
MLLLPIGGHLRGGNLEAHLLHGWLERIDLRLVDLVLRLRRVLCLWLLLVLQWKLLLLLLGRIVVWLRVDLRRREERCGGGLRDRHVRDLLLRVDRLDHLLWYWEDNRGGILLLLLHLERLLLRSHELLLRRCELLLMLWLLLRNILLGRRREIFNDHSLEKVRVRGEERERREGK